MADTEDLLSKEHHEQIGDEIYNNKRNELIIMSMVVLVVVVVVVLSLSTNVPIVEELAKATQSLHLFLMLVVAVAVVAITMTITMTMTMMTPVRRRTMVRGTRGMVTTATPTMNNNKRTQMMLDNLEFLWGLMLH